LQLLPTIQPTRKLLTEVAKRAVTVREGGRLSRLAVTEAVIVALGNGAMKGGISAQRTWLGYQLALDAQFEAERREYV